MPSSASPRYVRLTPSLHDALPIFAPQNIQASGELIDARDRFSDSTEGILPESGIIKMHREILQHQAKRRRRILKIVDKECGNSLKRSEEHTSELQSRGHLVCRLLLPHATSASLLPYTTLFRSLPRKTFKRPVS